MADYTFFCPKTIEVTQNAQLSVIPYNNYQLNIAYDYILDVNVNMASAYSMNTIFNTLHYQYKDDTDTVVSRMRINNDAINAVFSASTVLVKVTESKQSDVNDSFAADYFPPEKNTISNKFKEILAAKIFGAAIAIGGLTNNTHQNFDNNIYKNFQISIDSVFADATVNNVFFNQYVQSSRFQKDQDGLAGSNYNLNVPYNLAGTKLEFPVWFNGVLFDNSDRQITSTLYPTIAAASNRVVINGTSTVFNIPLLLSLHD
jgi:hypothetical protein